MSMFNNLAFKLGAPIAIGLVGVVAVVVAVGINNKEGQEDLGDEVKKGFEDVLRVEETKQIPPNPPTDLTIVEKDDGEGASKFVLLFKWRGGEKFVFVMVILIHK